MEFERERKILPELGESEVCQDKLGCSGGHCGGSGKWGQGSHYLKPKGKVSLEKNRLTLLFGFWPCPCPASALYAEWLVCFCSHSLLGFQKHTLHCAQITLSLPPPFFTVTLMLHLHYVCHNLKRDTSASRNSFLFLRSHYQIILQL